MRRTTDFRIDNGRLNVADADVFKRDPVNLIRFFAQAERNGLALPSRRDAAAAPVAAADRRQAAQRPGGQPHLPRAADRARHPEMTLRRMNEAGVLGRFVPDFGRVVVDDAVQYVPFRARIRSPTPMAESSPPRCFLSPEATSTRGRAPSCFHSAGSATRSPSPSRATTS